MSDKQIFRKEALKSISSPEQLTDYLHVTNPTVWIVLVTIIVLLVGIFAWSTVGTLESTVETNIQIMNKRAVMYTVGEKPIQFEEGMTVRIHLQDQTREFKVEKAVLDEDGWLVGYFQADLPDGFYNGMLVLDSTKPISFLLESR